MQIHCGRSGDCSNRAPASSKADRVHFGQSKIDHTNLVRSFELDDYYSKLSWPIQQVDSGGKERSGASIRTITVHGPSRSLAFDFSNR